MQMQGSAERVTIYIGESNHYRSRSLYMALLELLRREGALGATVLRGLAGFGAHSRIHTASIIDLSTDLPIVVVWVDLPERVDRLLPQVRRMVDDGLITREAIEVVQYAPGRRADPLAQPVRDLMRTEVLSVRPDSSVVEVVGLLLERGYRSLAVVEADGRLVGLITDGDLLRRTGLVTRLGLQAELSAASLQRQLAEFGQHDARARDIMAQPVWTVQQDDSVRTAVELMAEHDVKRLPVVDEQQRLVGWISRIDILRSVEYHQHGQDPAVETPRSGATVSELMYGDVPTVGPQARLDEILRALESSRRRRAVVVDDQRHVLGIISDGDLVRRSRQAQHPSLVSRLRALVAGQPAPASPLPTGEETARDLMTAPVITVTTETPLPEALRLMVQHEIKRLPVVDAEGHLVGLLGRASLLHGLLQSEPPELMA